MALRVFRAWSDDLYLLSAVRGLFVYGPGDDRATGYVFSAGEQGWPEMFAVSGPGLLGRLESLLGVRFEVVAFQAYLDGAGCDWHTDEAFDAQAVLSLGVSRSFGVRGRDGSGESWLSLAQGDLVFMPAGFQRDFEHCVPVEGVMGERCSLVFRTVAR